MVLTDGEGIRLGKRLTFAEEEEEAQQVSVHLTVIYIYILRLICIFVCSQSQMYQMEAPNLNSDDAEADIDDGHVGVHYSYENTQWEGIYIYYIISYIQNKTLAESLKNLTTIAIIIEIYYASKEHHLLAIIVSYFLA